MFLVLILIFVNNLNAYRILGLFPYPGKSHFQVFRPLLDALHERGHHLTVISYFPQNKSDDRYRDISLTDYSDIYVNVYEFDQLKQNRIRRYYGAKTLFDLGISMCKVLETERMRQFLKERNQFDVILAEMFITDCFYGFADRFNAPIIGLSSCNLLTWVSSHFGNPHNPSYVPNVFLDHSDKITSVISRAENLFLAIIQQLFYNFYFIPKQNVIAKQYFGSNLPHLPDIINRHGSLLLVNTHFTINMPKPLMPNIIEVAGMHLEPPNGLSHELESFIDSAADGVIFVSMGSMIRGDTLPKEKMLAFVQVFAQMPQKFIWKWENEEMANKPSNVFVKKWLPQFEILSHPNVKGFISHGGLLSTIEMVHCGIPAIIFPAYGDQFANAAALEERKVAIVLKLPEVDETKLSNALQSILSDKYQKRAKYLSEMFRDRPKEALNTSVYWIEYIGKFQGANEIKSAAINLPFYQYYLLDICVIVIAYVFVVVFLVLGVKKAFRTDNFKVKRA